MDSSYLYDDNEILMDNTNRHFKGQHENEEVLCFCRRHWIVLLPHMVVFFIFCIFIILFFTFVSTESLESAFAQSNYRFLMLLPISLGTLYMHRFFLRVFNYYLQTIIITNNRVITLEQTLYFTRTRDSIDLTEIQDIVVKQHGIMQTLLNYGELIITLSSAHSTKTLERVPNPEYYFRKINKTKSEYTAKKSPS